MNARERKIRRDLHRQIARARSQGADELADMLQEVLDLRESQIGQASREEMHGRYIDTGPGAWDEPGEMP